MNKLKIALVKQEVYQDLYVCPVTEKDPGQILFSSMGRVGPIALMSDLNADFYIVKEESNKETRIYQKVIPHIAVSCYTIDWGQYDIVISINISLPTQLILKYPQTLFAYMIGEANMATGKARFGYDATLNQMARGRISHKCGAIDFPYTFVAKDTLEKIMQQYLGRPSARKGIFMEINSTTERPVTRIPDHFQPLADAGYEIILHQQKIADNLKNIYDAKYFVKMGGRSIRGNSVAEAVSLGTLAIMNRDEVIHHELIIDECNVKTMDEMISLINRLENDPELYRTLQQKQRQVLHTYFFDAPLQSLINCLKEKRGLSKPRTYSRWNRLFDNLYFLKLR